MARHALPLCLLLSLVVASTATAFRVLQVKKPGQCPPIPKMTCMMMNPPNRCKDDDSNCPGNQKCCPVACGKSCKKPRGSRKPGECPPTPKMACMMMNPPNRCQNDDSNCPGNLKCCPVVCGKSCKKPRGSRPANIDDTPGPLPPSGASPIAVVNIEKPGKCPAVRQQCRRLILPDRCKSDDSNCPGDKKCCTGRCGKECTKPAQEKRGECPVVRKQCRRLIKPDRCNSDDSKCPGDKKCCIGTCGKICRKPVTPFSFWWRPNPRRRPVINWLDTMQ